MILTAKIVSGGRRIVRLTQHVPPVAVADNHTAAAEATLAQRGDRMIMGKKRDKSSSRVSLLLLNSTFT